MQERGMIAPACHEDTPAAEGCTGEGLGFWRSDVLDLYELNPAHRLRSLRLSLDFDSDGPILQVTRV
ncbi:hypothetical protein BIU82_08960 [Arthrobacter sp. SW1]|nr:hypothetical protein BIU82_08960 [Arthrobacter sp. SW1]